MGNNKTYLRTHVHILSQNIHPAQSFKHIQPKPIGNFQKFPIMLKLHMQLLKNPQLLKQITRGFASFQNRDFLYETSDGEFSGSLITRFARHVVIKEAKVPDMVQYNVRYEDYFPVHDLRSFVQNIRKVSTDNLPRMLVYTSIFRSRSEIPIFVNVINQLDDESSQRVHEMNSRQMIETLNGFMYLIPNKLAQLDFYRFAMEKLVVAFEENQTADDFVKILFYLGMWKRRGTQQMAKMLSFIESHMDQLQTEDFAIVANAAFKASAKVKAQKFDERLLEEIEKTEDLSLLVTFIKSCRLNKLKSDRVINRIRQGVESNEFEKSDIRAISHLFACLAENLHSEDVLNNFFLEKGLQLIKGNTRPKDISTFLWSCAHLGLDVDKNYLEKIDLILHSKNENGDYRYASDELVDSCLSLLMLGLRSDLAEDIHTPYRKNPEKTKLDSRKILLNSCLGILGGDRPKPKKAPAYLVRPSLVEVQKELNAQCEFVLAVNELNSASILTDKTYYEVLDESNVTSSGSPSGLMKLKLKMMSEMGCQVKIINVLTDDWKSALGSEDLDKPKEQNLEINS